MSRATDKEREIAALAIDCAMDPPRGGGEVICVLNAIANKEDPSDALAEYRYLRSPHVRQANKECEEAWMEWLTTYQEEKDAQ